MKIGTLLKTFRELRGIDRNEFHNESGFSRSYISAIENNKKENPTTNVLQMYAKICDVRVSTILRIQEDSERYSWDNKETVKKVGEALYKT